MGTPTTHGGLAADTSTTTRCQITTAKHEMLILEQFTYFFMKVDILNDNSRIYIDVGTSYDQSSNVYVNYAQSGEVIWETSLFNLFFRCTPQYLTFCLDALLNI